MVSFIMCCESGVAVVYQEEFEVVSGRSLLLPRVPLGVVAVGCGVWSACGGALLLPLLHRAGRPLWLAALAAHAAVESALLAATAALHCRAARAVARDIAASLQRHSRDVSTLDGHRCLWLRLSRLVRDLGSGLLAPLSVLLLAHFVLLTLASYALLGSLLNTASLPVPAAAFLVVTAATTLTTCCDSGHRTTTQVRSVVEDKLEAIREEPSSPVSLYKMFDVFLKTMTSFPAKIDLAGMTTMNRGLLTSMVSTMVTYLVVIVQFRVSHEVLKISNNETNVFATKASK